MIVIFLYLFVPSIKSFVPLMLIAPMYHNFYDTDFKNDSISAVI